jgi:hypothetical protein
MGAGEKAMTLELSRVAGQVEAMGQELARGMRHREKVLPALRALLREYAGDEERLAALAVSAEGQRRRCAVPSVEPLDSRVPAPDAPVQASVLAADGSQIYPDPHGLALYYLINVGTLIYLHGSGQAPRASSQATLGYAVDADGSLLSSERINARRDVAEMQSLADLAEKLPSSPAVALLDSTLGLRAWAATIPQAEQEALQSAYLAQMDRVRLAGVALAGFVGRSRQTGTVNLLDVGRMEDPASSSPEPSPFAGLTDQVLWGDLEPGQRSALLHQPGALPVYFFYLNTEPPDAQRMAGTESEPARIELPECVALSPEKLGQVHALVYDQCRLNNGYPYALTRADELAIILNQEREALEAMLLQAMSRHDMPLPRMSYKAAQKRIARAPSRRRL